MNILLVGGAVRNLLLGRPVVDKDFLVNGISREAFRRRFPQAQEVGHHFPVFLINGEEYALLRGDTLENDLLLRDFTINAMAIGEDGELFAHPDSLQDLHAKRLSPCGEKTFHTDPLRIFRAARFLAELDDFQPTEPLVRLMRDASVNGLTRQVSAERVGKELRRALASGAPSRFLELLQRTGHLSPWFEELAPAASIPAGPKEYHQESVLGHTMQVMDRLAGQGPLRVWMGMVHDLGKCTTDPSLLPRHIGHEKRGPALAAALADRLRLPMTYRMAGEKAARHHMLAGRYNELRPGTRVDLLQALGSETAVEDLFAVSRADHGSCSDRNADNESCLERDHCDQALADFRAMQGVRLPEKDRDLGPRSGLLLRELRAQSLAGRGSPNCAGEDK